MTGRCGAPLKGVYKDCDRAGEARYGGRCWQHRPPTSSEREEAKLKRRAAFEAAERETDLNAAKLKFLRLSLSLGLDAPETREAFEAYRGLEGK